MQSLRQFFSFLNDVNFPYVVLRNWDNLPDSVELGQHSDLDLLVYDLDHFLEIISEAEREFKEPRVRFKVPIGDEYIYVDVRSIYDGYYPSHFAMNVINTREWNENGFFTPNPIHHRIALAYHVVHHKNGMSNNYRRYLGDSDVYELLEVLKESNVGWTEPSDPSVGRFNPYWKGATSVIGKEDGKITKTQVSYLNYDLISNEHRILSNVDSAHFPKQFGIDKENKIIYLEDCGSMLSSENLPDNWKEQFQEISSDLDRFNIEHRDIKPDNFMVKDGVIKLIDFGWARFKSDEKDNPPSCLGFPYKPSYGFDDKFSLRKVTKVIEEEIYENTCN